MPTELIKRINLDLMYPPFVEKYLKLLAGCQERGESYYAISGTRTIPEQDELFAQGRTKPGPIVTKAKGGQSYHNFGIAADSCKDKDMARAGLQPSWKAEDYVRLALEGEGHGLEAGAWFKSFPDYPHIQLHISKHGLTLPQLKRIYDSEGMPGVWKFLDGFKW